MYIDGRSATYETLWETRLGNDVRYCRRAESFQKGQRFTVVPFVKYVLFQVRVCREVNRRKRDITQQTRRCATVKTQEAELADNMNCTSWYSTLCFGCFALDL